MFVDYDKLSITPLSSMEKTQYCESTFIRWHQCSWFLLITLIPGFLNSSFLLITLIPEFLNSWFLLIALIPEFLNSWFLLIALIPGFLNSWLQTLQVWLSLWYLLAIVLSVLLFTDSDYPFGIFWPLYCLFFFYLRILIIPLVSFGHCVVCSSIYGF